MKIKNLIKTCAICGIVACATTMLVGCKKDKEKEPTPTNIESHIEQTYTKLSNARSSTSEKDVVSVKLKQDNSAYLIYNLLSYKGTYLENTETPEKDYILSFNNEDNHYKISMEILEDSVRIQNFSNSDNLLGSSSIELSKTEDFTFENGLYVGLGSYYNSEYSKNIEQGAYTYKINNNEIYGSDGVESAYKINVEVIGNNLIYTNNYDRAGENGETNLFFVEKKGQHDQEFIDLFGDLDNVIYYCEQEASRLNKYYEVKQTERPTLQITENITFNATKIFKTLSTYNGESWNISHTYESANIELNINTNNTVTLNITGNDNYNISTSGKWYNIGNKSAQGLLIVLDDDNFFNGYFALGTYDDDDITIQHLLEDEVTSYINANDSTKYTIGWNEETESEIENSEEWIES